VSASLTGGRTSAVESSRTWPLIDRIMLAFCWIAGISACVIAFAIVAFMAYKGLEFLRPNLFVERPNATFDQSKSGGFLDPLIGTILLTTMGTLVAIPVSVAVAIWLTEYGRPFGLARAVESAVEIIAGTPSIVLAIFGLIIFQQEVFGFLSFRAEGGSVFGRSFFTAALMMSLIALPLIVGATREGLQAIPSHVREASYALGKSKWATIQRVLLPSVRPAIGTGTVLGMGRIAGDTAIVVVLLGASLQIQGYGDIPGLDILRGNGGTLTSYTYVNSPAGEGAAPDKAYAAAFVLLMISIGLNLFVSRLARSGKSATAAATR
jgi:phosphate transport system permease protein